MNIDKIIKAIAKKHGVSEAEVRKDMQSALYAAYTSASDSFTTTLQQDIPHKGIMPTPEEFIEYVAKSVKK